MVINDRNIQYSIVIPTSNHPELLARCLSALIKADQPTFAWEALVIDNSSDQLKPLNANVVGDLGDKRFKYFSVHREGLMAARHRGVELAHGHIISFLDDDSFVAKTWLEGIEQSFEDSKTVLVGGPNKPLFEVEPPSWVDDFWVRSGEGKWLGALSLLDFGNEGKEISPLFVFGCNYSIRKDIFMLAEGSHPDYMPREWRKYQGDGETALSVKVEALGYQAKYCPQCAIQHFVPGARMTLEYFGKRAYFVGWHQGFAAIRREHGLGPHNGVPAINSERHRLRLPTFRALLNRSRRSFSRFGMVKAVDEGAKIKKHVEECYEKGLQDIRREAKKDDFLMEYILRPNFIGENAKLPSVPRGLRSKSDEEPVVF